jgi:hypothetical protein
MRKQLLNQRALMAQQNCMVIGLQKTIEKLIQCLLAMEYFLIMRGQDVEKRL